VNIAALEISVRKTQIDAYAVELRFDYDKQADVNASCDGTMRADLSPLLAAEADAAEYGRLLTDCLFEDDCIRDTFLSAINLIQANGDGCRFRLFIHNSALELQKLRWELLQRPDTRERLSTSDHILFSRYLFSRDFRAVQLRPRSEIRVLIALSTLTEEHSARFNLPRFDVEAEVARVQKSFSGLACDVLGVGEPLTFGQLWEALRNREYDILYLLGHGTAEGRRPVFFIEHKQAGRPPIAEPQEFVDRFSGLLRVPRLVVLGSCQSSYTNMALGPRLVEAGIPAVIAMQDSISLTTLDAFTAALFGELTKHGAIDLAVAAARDVIRQSPDCWMPVLFSRLKDNRIWFEAGFTAQRETPAHWNTIIDRAQRSKLVPIIGPGFGEYLHGDLRDLARSIVETYQLPRQLWNTESFPQACQSLLAVDGDRDTFVHHVLQVMTAQLQRYHSGVLPEARFADTRFEDLLWEISQALPKTEKRDAYELLAELDTPIFVMTTRDDLLSRSLQAKGKKPQVIECPWRESDTEALLHDATPECPIVYHVFGRFANEESLVLTEDDFFEFLVQATNNRDLIPEVIRSKTMHGSLAFLGFHLTDWSLRVLQKIFKSQEGSRALPRHVHVAVQLNRADDAQSQSSHLATYLSGLISEFGQVQIFWGRPEDFLTQLLDGLHRRPPLPLSRAA
jgi:CHAT domain/SIR2-like domain